MSETPKHPYSMPLSTVGPMKAEMPATVRKRFIVKGRVQKVGYRDEVQEIARALGVTGFVRNLKSGDVEVACEGAEDTLGKFENALAMKKDLIEVREVVPAGEPPEKGRFAYFEIKYGPMEEELGERMGAGIQHIKDVGQKVDGVGKAVETVGQKVEGVGKAVETVGQKVDGVGKDVRNMHGDMNTRFDHMAERYDMIAASLKEAIVHMDRNSARTDRAIERSRKESALDANRTRKEIAKIRKETVVEVRRSQKETAEMLAKNHKETSAELARARKDFADSNRELAGAVKFMIRRLSDSPAGRGPAGKRKR